MSQRDKAERKAKRHGTWGGTHRAQRKHRASVIKHRHRAGRRLDQAVVEEERQMAEDEIGPTGEFPQGKIHEHDEGELALRVGHTEAGKVVMEFGKSVTWLGMDPEHARALADGLVKHADEAEKMRG